MNMLKDTLKQQRKRNEEKIYCALQVKSCHKRASFLWDSTVHFDNSQTTKISLPKALQHSFGAGYYRIYPAHGVCMKNILRDSEYMQTCNSFS